MLDQPIMLGYEIVEGGLIRAPWARERAPLIEHIGVAAIENDPQRAKIWYREDTRGRFDE